MPSISVELEIGRATHSFDIDAECEFFRYGGTHCDSPEYVEILGQDWTWSDTGKPVDARFLRLVTPDQRALVDDLIVDAASGW